MRCLMFLILSMVLFPWTVFAQLESSHKILGQVYGSISTACTQDADADNGEHNRLAMAAGRRWIVYCHDGAGSGVACECLQGTVTVDASAAVGVTLFAGEKIIVKQNVGNGYISCEPFVANQYYDICLLD